MKVEVKGGLAKTSDLTRKRLKGLLEYNPETGTWTWLVATGQRVKAGSIAGTINRHGYRVIQIDGVKHSSSRLAFYYMTGTCPTEVDHRNRIRHDDCWENIRTITRRYNNNRNRGIQTNNASGITGVCFHRQRNKWQAQVGGGGKVIHLGIYSELHDAVMARYCGELKYNWAALDPNTPAKQYTDKYFNRSSATKTGVTNELQR